VVNSSSFFLQKELPVQLRVTNQNDFSVVSVVGRIDTQTSPDFQSGMTELVSGGSSKIVLDCSDLEYVSSAGLRVILMAAKAAKAAGGDLKCCSMQDMVKKVFEISGFSVMIPICDSVKDAME
jgi:anti-sigma B factor antagonist